jgi:hypothetical protein
MTCGMLATNGLALAMGRRASVSLSLGKIAAARRFFGGCVALGIVWTAVLTLILSVLPLAALSFLGSDRVVFVVTAVVVAVVWLTASALSLVTAAGWSGVALTSGLGVAAGVNHLLLHVTSRHLAIGTLTGLALALVAMLAVLDHHARRLPRAMVRGRQRLPSLGYMALEGRPYFLYGSLAVLMLVSVHAVGWAYLDSDRVRIATLEVGLFLPLLPAVLGAGRAERSLREFWEYAGELQQTTRASDRAAFGTQLYRRYLRELGGYLAGIIVNSLLTAIVIELLLRAHLLGRLVAYGNVHDVRILYATGLLAYGLMGLGQFNSMFSLSFLHHRRPLISLSSGVLVTLVASVCLCSWYGYRYLGIALAAGGFVFAFDSFFGVRPLLSHADHLYVTAV